MMFVGRKESTIAVVAAALWWLAGAPLVRAQTRTAIAATREKVRTLHAKSSEVQITLAQGRTLRGQIVQVANETFVVRQKAGAEETVEYARVSKISKQGIRKSVLVPAVVGGAVLAVLCVAPYPIGFLCRRDPS